jgi:anthranilate phosphoribosyltransferase
MRDILLKLCRREDLTRDEARAAFEQIISGKATDSQIGGLLVGLAAKGTTVEELVGAATLLREKLIPLSIPPQQIVLDTCGTGGDVKGTFNISTAAALIVAGAGVKVAKHGNRSASSRAGSADVLERLGVNVELSPTAASACLDKANICFAFARLHHPALKSVAHVRSSLAIPTIFNMLAPLLNPAAAKHQLIGVFAPELTDRFALVLRELGSAHAWIVHAEDGLDEISTLGPTRISELKAGHIKTWTLDPKTHGIPYARLSDLQIANVDDAAAAILSVLNNDPGPKRDIALLNAAAALVVAEAATDLSGGLELARKSLEEGLAKRTLERLIQSSNPQTSSAG